MRHANSLRCLVAALMLAAPAIGCAPMAGRETPGEYVDDVTISTKVRAEIVSQLGLKQIGVETMQNVVQLSGFVDTAQIKIKAGEIAWRVSGVKDVRNNLVVR